MEMIIETSFPVINPKGERIQIALTVSAPKREDNGQWSMSVDCPSIPYATGTFIRHNPLTCVCFTLNMVKRFMKEEFGKGYTVEHWAEINDFLDEMFDV